MYIYLSTSDTNPRVRKAKQWHKYRIVWLTFLSTCFIATKLKAREYQAYLMLAFWVISVREYPLSLLILKWTKKGYQNYCIKPFYVILPRGNQWRTVSNLIREQTLNKLILWFGSDQLFSYQAIKNILHNKKWKGQRWVFKFVVCHSQNYHFYDASQNYRQDMKTQD